MKVKLVTTLIYSDSFGGIMPFKEYKGSEWESKDKYDEGTPGRVYLRRNTIMNGVEGDEFEGGGHTCSLDPDWYDVISESVAPVKESTNLTEIIDTLVNDSSRFWHNVAGSLGLKIRDIDDSWVYFKGRIPKFPRISNISLEYDPGQRIGAPKDYRILRFAVERLNKAASYSTVRMNLEAFETALEDYNAMATFIEKCIEEDIDQI